MTQETAGTRLLDWAVAARTLAGQDESGDRHLVDPFPGGVLVAVMDGLGHGPDAAAASRAAAAALAGHAHLPPVDLVKLCHDAIRSTRGVVLSLASFSAAGRTMAWLGVGDVDGVLVRARPGPLPPREGLLLRGGVVGYQLPPLRASQLAVGPGDVLVLATDGIRGGFADRLDVQAPPQQIADDVLARHGKGTDDALVLVARYLGAQP